MITNWDEEYAPPSTCSLGGGGSSGGTTTNTSRSSTEPFAEQKPFMVRGFEEAEKEFESPRPTFFPGSTVAEFAPETELALGAQAGRAISGSPNVLAGQQENLDTIRGNYLSTGNPFFQDVYPQIEQEVRNSVDSAFAGGRRYGSGLHSQQLAKELSRTAGGLAFKNYQDERARQMAMTGLAPQLANQDYYDIGQLDAAGRTREALKQQQINEQIRRHNFAQTAQANKIAQFANLVSGNFGTSTTGQQTTTGPSGSGLLTGLGAGAAGTGMLVDLFGGGGLFPKVLGN